MRRVASLSLCLAVALSASVAHAQTRCVLKPQFAARGSSGLCGFDARQRSFAGTPAEQASCLLRSVGRGAVIGGPSAPRSLIDRAGEPVPFAAAALAAWLTGAGIQAGDLGGPLTIPHAARYFVIHDTSTPNCSVPGACAR